MNKLLTKNQFLDLGHRQGLGITYRALRKYMAEGIFPRPIKGKRYLGLYDKNWIKGLKIIKMAINSGVKIKDIKKMINREGGFKFYGSYLEATVDVSSKIYPNFPKVNGKLLNNDDGIAFHAFLIYNSNIKLIKEFINSGETHNFNAREVRAAVRILEMAKKLYTNKIIEAKKVQEGFDIVINFYKKLELC